MCCYNAVNSDFDEFDDFDDFCINRCIHIHTFEGDSQKPSRQENEGPLLILSLFVLFYDGCKQKPRASTSLDSDTSRSFRIR